MKTDLQEYSTARFKEPPKEKRKITNFVCRIRCPLEKEIADLLVPQNMQEQSKKTKTKQQKCLNQDFKYSNFTNSKIVALF